MSYVKKHGRASEYLLGYIFDNIIMRVNRVGATVSIDLLSFVSLGVRIWPDQPAAALM